MRAAKACDPRLAEALLLEAARLGEALRPEMYAAVVIACTNVGGLVRAEAWLGRMTAAGFRVSHDVAQSVTRTLVNDAARRLGGDPAQRQHAENPEDRTPARYERESTMCARTTRRPLQAAVLSVFPLPATDAWPLGPTRLPKLWAPATPLSRAPHFGIEGEAHHPTAIAARPMCRALVAR